MISFTSPLWAAVASYAKISAACTQAFLRSTSQHAAVQQPNTPFFSHSSHPEAHTWKARAPWDQAWCPLKFSINEDRPPPQHPRHHKLRNLHQSDRHQPNKTIRKCTWMTFTGNQITTTGLIATHLGLDIQCRRIALLGFARELEHGSGSKRRQQCHDLSARRQLFGRFGNIKMNVAWGAPCARLEVASTRASIM